MSAAKKAEETNELPKEIQEQIKEQTKPVDSSLSPEEQVRQLQDELNRERTAKVAAQLKVKEQETMIHSLVEKKQGTISGWIVSTPHPEFSGITQGVQFRNGRAFVRHVGEAEKTVNLMVQDFGYSARYVEDIDNYDPGMAEDLNKRMTEVI